MIINLPFSNYKQWDLTQRAIGIETYNKAPKLFWALRRLIRSMGFEDIKK